jgi:type II secretory pathway pseudopilin PulG
MDERMCPRPVAPSRESGMSLVELMIALAASVLVIGSTTSMAVQQARMRQVDDEIQLALAACRNNLEEMRSLPLTSLPGMHNDGFDVPGSNGEPGGLQPVPGDADGLPGVFSVTVDQTVTGETNYLVRATVRWTGVLREQTFELETVIGERQ